MRQKCRHLFDAVLCAPSGTRSTAASISILLSLNTNILFRNYSVVLEYREITQTLGRMAERQILHSPPVVGGDLEKDPDPQRRRDQIMEAEYLHRSDDSGIVYSMPLRLSFNSNVFL